MPTWLWHVQLLDLNVKIRTTTVDHDTPESFLWDLD